MEEHLSGQSTRPERPKLRRIAHVELRVRDLGQSVAFYRDLLGLERTDAVPPSESTCVCTAKAETGERFGLVLTAGLPSGTEVTGLDHVGFEVPTRQDVRDVYDEARRKSIRATQPREFNGYYQSYVFDPDGYKIEVIARPGDASEAETE